VKNEVLIIDWYKKETNSGRYLSYYSGHLLCHEVSTIYGLVDTLITSKFLGKKSKTRYKSFD